MYRNRLLILVLINNKTVGIQLESEGKCSTMYYVADLTYKGLESVAHDGTVGSFSSETPIKN